VAVIECVCPARPDGSIRHPDGDTVNLRMKLDYKAAATVRYTVVLLKEDDGHPATPAEILAAIAEAYLFVGIESWTLTDAKGRPVPVERGTIQAFMDEHLDAAMAVGDEANGIYFKVVMSPLADRASTYSPPTPINGSTSATNGSSPARPRPSKRSSTTTTRTEDTVKMSASPGGGYNS
jgi:hypothetical protein